MTASAASCVFPSNQPPNVTPETGVGSFPFRNSFRSSPIFTEYSASALFPNAPPSPALSLSDAFFPPLHAPTAISDSMSNALNRDMTSRFANFVITISSWFVSVFIPTMRIIEFLYII